MPDFHKLGRLARNIVKGNTPAQADDQPTLELHQMTVTHVDQFSGVVNVTFADGTPVSGVRYVQAYSAANPPTVNDVVWVHKYGTDLMVVGQHVVPTNFVTVS